jgi:hypothetical protein
VGAGMSPSRWQWGTTAWAVRRQPCPAMGTELPVRFEFAAAFETFFEELVPFRMQLQQCGLFLVLPGLLRLFLVVHYVPFLVRISTGNCPSVLVELTGRPVPRVRSGTRWPPCAAPCLFLTNGQAKRIPKRRNLQTPPACSPKPAPLPYSPGANYRVTAPILRRQIVTSAETVLHNLSSTADLARV